MDEEGSDELSFRIDVYTDESCLCGSCVINVTCSHTLRTVYL